MKYSIYQIKKEKTREVGFLSLGIFKEFTNQPDDITMEGTYDLVYSGEIEPKVSNLATLESLFHKFNMERPEDFKGHSMSVGDIVKLGRLFYYCDSFGFEWVHVSKVPKTVQGSENICRICR
jgi:hypothetical protein